MTFNLNVKTILLKMWFSLIIFSTTSAKIDVLVSSIRYEIPMILRYDFDWGSLEVSTWFDLMLLTFLIYLLMVWRFKVLNTLLVVIIMLLLFKQTKSVTISDLIFLKALLMLEIWTLEFFIKQFLFSIFIETITGFLDSLLVVILMWGFGQFSLEINF